MEAKKISFGFSKINKKVNLLPAGPSVISGNAKQQYDGEKIELISCLEGQSIKIIGKENGDDKPPPLVIPLREQDKTTIPDRLAKLQDIIEGKDTEEPIPKPDEEVSEGPVDGETIEQRAAREILEDLKERKSRSNEKNSMVVPLKPEDLPLDGGRESTMDDYESVPIEKFGLAMLRGMGWKEDPNAPKKDNKFPEGPIQRPKGMGLGAERVPKDKNRQLIPPAKDEVLTMNKGAFVKVLAGKHKDSYGTVQSLDEENARVVVRFSITGSQESLNEYLLQLVSNAEFKKYSKVLNNAKYEEFKNRTPSGAATVAIKEEKPDDRKIIKREPSDSPPPPRATSSHRAKSSGLNRDHVQQRDRRDHSPDRHKHRDREDRLEENNRHRRPRERRSRSREDRRHDKHRSAISSSDDDDTDSNESDERYRGRPQQQHRHKTSSSSSYTRTSSGTKKKSHKYKQRRDHSRERVYSSDEDDRHHKKKTKKSKKQRSRSRSRR